LIPSQIDLCCPSCYHFGLPHNLHHDVHDFILDDDDDDDDDNDDDDQ